MVPEDAFGRGALWGRNWSTVLAYKGEFCWLEGCIEVDDQVFEGLWDSDSWKQ